MFYRNHGCKLFFVLLILFLSSPCTVKHTPRTAEDFSREILRLEKLLGEQQAPSLRALSHLELARLYSHYKNPRPDYGKSLRELEAYMSLEPEGARREEFLNWFSLLRRLDQADKEIARMKEKLQKAEQETFRLQEKIETLIEENSRDKEALSRGAKEKKGLQARVKDLQDRLESLEKSHQNLQEANRALKESNESYKKAIERLKRLDREMEEKRKSIR